MKRLLTCVTLFLLSGTVLAFTPDLEAIEDSTLINRYPPRSLVNEQSAEHALRQVQQAQKQLEEKIAYAARRCGENLFVNRCVDQVHRAGTVQKRRLAAIEYEARTVLREARTRHNAERQRERDAKAAQGPRAVRSGAPQVKPERTVSRPTVLQKRAQEAQQRQQQAVRKQALQQDYAAERQQKQQQRDERARARDLKVQKRAQKEARGRVGESR